MKFTFKEFEILIKSVEESIKEYDKKLAGVPYGSNPHSFFQIYSRQRAEVVALLEKMQSAEM